MSFDAPDLERIVRGLTAQPEIRHAIAVASEADVASVRQALEAAVARVLGPRAVLGRSVRIQVERDDAGLPARVWLYRALVGGQRPAREGFSGKQDKLGR
ncbi:MAG: hypothetical protein FJ029_06210 [Actinobacteria bacterium]|nr:hypothetical protein [Actinomycetota bacterium]